MRKVAAFKLCKDGKCLTTSAVFCANVDYAVKQNKDSTVIHLSPTLSLSKRQEIIKTIKTSYKLLQN